MRYGNKTLASGEVVLGDSYSADVSDASLVAAYAKWTVNSPTASTFAAADIDLANDSIGEPSHGFLTGLVGQLTTTGTLPTGLAAATDYYVIQVDANTYKLATSASNAEAGTAIDLTDGGTGDHTFTPKALSGASIKYQKSADGVNWTDISGASASITAAGEYWYEASNVAYGQIRAVFAIASGSIDLQINVNKK